ncbi:MAG: hypothetical protein ACX93I_01460 [Winogradskyella sp.]
MPNANDTFITTLRRAHLEWGSYRHTNSRGIRLGEGYLQIPISEARRLQIYNRNQVGGNTSYTCDSADGFLNHVVLKSSGCIRRGDIHAKQFHGRGNLQLLGDWFNHVDAQIGDEVEIRWTSPTHMVIRKL